MCLFAKYDILFYKNITNYLYHEILKILHKNPEIPKISNYVILNQFKFSPYGCNPLNPGIPPNRSYIYLYLHFKIITKLRFKNIKMLNA